MARRKVAPENRIRVAQACENCKRRKQKCNGSQPCNNCAKRGFGCRFLQSTQTQDDGSTPTPTKSRKRGHSELEKSSTGPGISSETAESGHSHESVSVEVPDGLVAPEKRDVQREGPGRSPFNHRQSSHDPFIAINVIRDNNGKIDEGNSPDSDEAEMQGASRMLNDGKGRMLYIGDSAPLSYLQTIRQLVNSVVGTSSFTLDPQRHKILETSVSTPPDYSHTFTLPDKEAAYFLVDSFFASTKGILHLFDERSFKQRLEWTYQDPLNAEKSWLCILNLVFANGLQLRLRRSHPSAIEAAILKRLLSDKFDRSEMFFLAAKHLKDPSNGFEDGDFSSIQALLLMALFVLCVGKRHTAWAYLGMAVRLAYALGLHRIEAQRMYEESERASRSVPRTILFRSLYVMDRFLSASLGRPTAINDEDCSEELFSNICKKLHRKEDNYEMQSLYASVKAARILGLILNQVYRPRKVSLKIARKIALRIQEWAETLPPLLKWQPDSVPNNDPGVALGQLHLWMMYFHTIVLLTRPFLLLHVKRSISQQNSQSPHPTQLCASSPAESRVVGNPQFEKYSAACVRSAIHMVKFLQTTRAKGCLPTRNPFIINWTFTSGLIVLTNSFLQVYENPENDMLVETVISLLRYSSEEDSLARRYLTIMSSFRETIIESRSLNRLSLSQSRRTDPIENLFPPKYTLAAGGRNAPRHESHVEVGHDVPSSVVDWTTRMSAFGPFDNIGGMDSNVGQWAGLEGLVMPATEDTSESDPGPVMEEIIHFDSLFSFGQDTTMTSDGLFPAQIPMYGTSNYV